MRCQFIIISSSFLDLFILYYRTSDLLFIYICSLTLLVSKIVLRTFLFDWLVLTGEQFSWPRRCLNITQKLEVSAYLQKERRVHTTILKFLCHICVNDIQTWSSITVSPPNGNFINNAVKSMLLFIHVLRTKCYDLNNNYDIKSEK